MRIAAVSLFLSGVTLFLPEASINSFLVWCGLEQMPDATMMRYILRGCGYLQMGFGVLLWVVARDVVRYQPVVIAYIAVFLVGAPAFYWIDATAGLPGYWCLLDFACCFLASAVPLAFWLWPTSPDKAPPRGTEAPRRPESAAAPPGS
jgi:hypothetical protein